MQEEKDYIYKIIVIGNVGAGKTSIIRKYTENTFYTNYKPTIGVDFALKTLAKNNKNIQLQLWDIAGQERFINMSRTFYKFAHAAIIVFDITKDKPLKSVFEWLNSVKANLGENIPVIVFANKCDVNSDLDLDIIEEINGEKSIIKLVKTSACINVGINESIDFLVDLLLEKDCCKNYLPDNFDTIDLNKEREQNLENDSQCCW